jgi:heparinase II/III-like protein
MKLGPRSLFQLGAHKALQRGRDALDHLGGNRRAERVARRRVQTLFASHPSLAVWLSRPEAGRLWLSPKAARRWAAACSDADLAWAEAIVAGRYTLLGVQAAPLGNPPDWHRDFYTGREWPRVRAGRLPLSRGDGSDIRTVWELSRCYHFVPLAKAYWRTGDARFLAAFRVHVESWLEHNPPGVGANWRSPMDAAIRAANWALAAVLFADAEELPRDFWVSLLANLRVTARFVARHLEWHPVYRGNHYLSNAVGLVYVGALFRDDPEGAGWLRRGGSILREEIGYQVCPDGVTGEAAIGYHRLVTEFFTLGGEICERSLPGFLPASYWERVRAMYGFISAYLDSAGTAPLLGDADDGRLHLLCAETAAQPASHRLGLLPRHWPARPAASAPFAEGGFYVLRTARSRCIVRCGPVGLHGAGSHDHNDQLSYELSVDGIPLISDSGTFTYTRDLAERFAFRGTAAHNAVQLGDDEQNPIRIDRPWRVLADRTRSQCLEWMATEAQTRFAGRHSGFSHRSSGAICFRTIEATAQGEVWRIQDRIEGQGSEALTWRTHFAPGKLAARRVSATSWTIEHDRAPGGLFTLEASAPLELQVAESRRSESYGSFVLRPVLILRGEVVLPLELTFDLRWR